MSAGRRTASWSKAWACGWASSVMAVLLEWTAVNLPAAVTDGDIKVAQYNYFTVVLGHGDGSFVPAVTYDYGSYFTLQTLADFDADGNTDVAATDGSTWLLLGNGDGTLREPQG